VDGNACCTNPNKFVNNGILAVSASSNGIATLGFMGLSIGGSVVVGKGSTLDVVSGQATFSPGAVVDNGGTVAFDKGETVKLATGVQVDKNTTVQLTGNAAFTGTGGFAGIGTFLWTGGHIEGNLTVAGGTTTTISGTGIKDESSQNGKPITVTLHGDTTVSGSGPVHLGTAANLDNTGSLTASSGTTFEAGICCAHPDRFTNSGSLTVAGGKKPVAFSLLAFVNSGLVKIGGKLVVSALSYTQTAGVTDLLGGSLSSNQPVLVKGGTLGGRGTVAAAVVNSGILSPSNTDVLTINGAYQQTKSGSFDTELAGTGKFGQVVVKGPAKLAGAIKISLAHGFKPKKGQSFQVMRYGSHTGSFTKKLGTPKYKISYSGSVHIKY
jgi:fibronectin-binding autotransporter adhesin